MKFLLFLIPIVLFAFFKSNKIKIKWKTFLEKGFTPNKNIYGVYCYCGKQGSGKTMSITEYCNDMIPSSISKDNLFMNIKSYNKKPYNYLKDLKELLKLRNRTDIVIVFDEIFTEITKLSKLDNETMKDVMDFLSQMRKRRIILLTSCQEWRLLPLYFRLYCRYQINCRLVSIPLIKGVLIKNIIDADNIKWSEEEQDFVGNLVENTVTHTRLSVANSYDTYETISKINNLEKQETLSDTSSDFFDIAPTVSDNKKNQKSISKVLKDNQAFKDFWGNDIDPNDFIIEKNKIIEEE